MIPKHNISLVLISILMLFSCNKANFEEPGIDRNDNKCELKIDFRNSNTKVLAQNESKEKTIQNIQIYVFRNGAGADNGVLDVCCSQGFDTELNISTGEYEGLSIKCSSGPRLIYAIINDSEDRTSVITNLNDLSSQTHDLNSSNPAKLLMLGKTSANLLPGENSISLSVKRMCASIVLNSVSNDFWSSAYQQNDIFRIEKVYLLNVPGRIDFNASRLASSLASEFWYNKASKDASSANLLLTWDEIAEGGSVIDYSQRYSHKHSFYTYPNECAFSSDNIWNPRATVLVVEASIKSTAGWTKYYYPVTIDPVGGIQSNKLYKVDLSIHRPGSIDPNEPVRFGNASPMIEVVDWETGETYTPEI